MNISIYIPWYNSYWFYSITTIILLAFLYLLIERFIIRLRKRNSTLEQIVQRRTKNLIAQQKKLNELNKNLILSNKELDKMVYNTSHDLKAPLKSVLGLLDLAKRDDTDNKLVNYFDLMEKSINNLETKISSTLKLSKNSKAEVKITDIDFEEIVNAAFEEIQFHEAIDKIDIQQRIDALEQFYSDESRLQIIINNLVSNAIKYHDTAKSHPRASIEITSKNNNVIIKVKDNGIGIPENMQKMFLKCLNVLRKPHMAQDLGSTSSKKQ